MKELQRKDPALFNELRTKYGDDVNPAELSADEMLRLLQSEVVTLPEKAQKTLRLAWKKELQ